MLLDNQRLSALFVLFISSFLCLNDCCAQISPVPTPAVKGSPTDVLAEVADTKLLRADYDKEIEAFKKFANPQAVAQISTIEGKADFLRQLVEVTMFEKKAKIEGLHNSDTYKNEVRTALINSLALNRIRKVVESVQVEESEVKKYYDANKKNFTEPDKYHLFWISTDTKEKADALYKELKAGKSFIEVAKANSIDDSKDNGGDKGFIRLEEVVPEIASALEKLEKDKISEPLNIAEGLYVICKYTEKTTGIIKPLEIVASQIRRELASEKQVQVFKAEIDKLKKAYNYSLDKKVAETLKKEKITEEEQKAVVAKYDGGTITVADLFKDLEQIPAFIRAQVLEGEGLNDFIEQHVAKVLSNFDVEKNFEARSKENPETVTDVSRRVLVKCLFDKILNPITVSEEEIKDYYNQNLASYKRPATMSAHHILVDDEATAKTIAENLKKDPSKFEEVAKESSKCPSGKQGGNLGNFSEGQMVPEFENACKTAEINTIVGPVKTQFGYHIIRVDSRKDASIAKLEEVKNDVRGRVLPAKQQTAFNNYLETLRKEFNVKVYSENL